MSESKIYSQYIRTFDRRPVGVVCAQVVDGKLKVGVAIESRPRYWNRKRGRSIAIGRMNKSTKDFFNIEFPSLEFDNADISIDMPDDFDIDSQIDSFVNNVAEKASVSA